MYIYGCVFCDTYINSTLPVVSPYPPKPVTYMWHNLHLYIPMCMCLGEDRSGDSAILAEEALLRVSGSGFGVEG